MGKIMTDKQKEMLDRMKTIMKEAEMDHKKGFHAKATKNLNAGLTTLTNVINKMKKEDVPTPLHTMQGKMATTVSKWKHEIKEGISSSKSGEIERKTKKVVDEFVVALKTHKKDASVSSLVESLTENSSKFKRGAMSFKEYKDACMDSIETHQKKHYKLHHKQPHGVFDHIKNAVRAMLRLLVKMCNHLTGSKSSMFKKPESDLGKETKEFIKTLKELKEAEPEAKHKAQPTKK
jgi:hypothetical protein